MGEHRRRIANVVARQGLSRGGAARPERALRSSEWITEEPSMELQNLGVRLRAQRRKSDVLLAQSAVLRYRCVLRQAETKLLCDGIGEFCKTLAGTFASIERVRRENCTSPRQSGTDRTDLEDVAAPRDFVSALADATELLRMEFLETEGSGRETLVKCEDALRKAQSVRTLILPLY